MSRRRLRTYLYATRQELGLMVAMPLFVFEWYVNFHDDMTRRTINGMRFGWLCDNWHTRRIGDTLRYRYMKDATEAV